MLVLKMAHRKWKETKQQPNMLPGQAVPGSCLVSFHILWAILSTSTVLGFQVDNILPPQSSLSPPHSEDAEDTEDARHVAAAHHVSCARVPTLGARRK